MDPRLAPEDVALETLEDDSNTQESTVNYYSSHEALVHNRPDDCWLMIHGRVYDVTSWIPHHPGGALIYVNAGKDCTLLFDAYHPLYVRKMLERYCIGEVKQAYTDIDECPESVTIKYEDIAGKEDFYLTLKKRVETHFRKMKVNPRVHPLRLFTSFLIFATYLLSYYFTFFCYCSGGFIWSIIAAVATGFSMAQVCMSIQHDASHGVYSDWRGLEYLMSASLDLVGASSFMWRQQHVVGHHCYTNVNAFDPDIRVKDPDVRRVTVEQPRQKYHYFQHWYLSCLYGLLTLKSIFVDDFMAYSSGSIGSGKISKMTTLELHIFWGGKLLYASYMFILPAIFSCHAITRVASLYLISQLIAGWVLAFLFQVGHVVEEAAFPVVEKSNGISKVSEGWAALQVRTTTNFCTESLFWTHISNGLNFQIEHHLFPGVCHFYLSSMQPIVRETCKEFNIPYNCFPSFWAALASHFQYMKRVGRNEFELHLDG